MKRILATIAICIASLIPGATLAQGNFLDFGKAAAGIVVFGAVACAATRAVFSQGLAWCTPTQYQQGVPFVAERHAHLLPPTFRAQYLGRVYVERTTAEPQVQSKPREVIYERLSLAENELAKVVHNCGPGKKPWVPKTCPTTRCEGKCVPDDSKK